jgi:hypothetical protein
MKSYLSVMLSIFAVSSCVASSDGVNGASKSDKGIYYRSQAEADAALAAFDKSNPTCQLWTNWQKMCSRTGPKGSTWCTTDSATPVRPSLTFCADTQGVSFLPNELDDRRQIVSAERFLEQNSRPSNFDSDEYRIKMIDGRPFSGKSLAGRRHPYCDVWARESDAKPVCAERGTFPELPRCSAVVASKIRTKDVLYCASENVAVAKSCPEPAGMQGSRRQVSRMPYPPQQGLKVQDILAVSDAEDYILSVNCRR